MIPSLLQDLQYRLLDESIQHRRDTKLAYPTTGFGYLYPLHRLRPVLPLQKRRLDSGPVLLEMAGQLFDGHPVDTRCSFVGLDLSQCCSEIICL